MSRRHLLAAAAVAATLLALTVSNIRYMPWTEAARTVEQRGPLSEAERANIEIFERLSPRSCRSRRAPLAIPSPKTKEKGQRQRRRGPASSGIPTAIW